MGQLAQSAGSETEGSFTRINLKDGSRNVMKMGYNGEGGEIGFINKRGANVLNIGVMPLTNQVFDRGDGVIFLSDMAGNLRLYSHVTKSDAGRVTVLDRGGNPTTYMDGELGFRTTRGDLAENFSFSVPDLPAGTVVVLDPANPGYLKPSAAPYDRRVAGVVSGAQDYKAGITLGAEDHDNGAPVTLTGTVYCKATSENGPIRAGDLLTTSAVSGHAMKVTNHDAARGAILGKAMESLDAERGVIMILASLQ